MREKILTFIEKNSRINLKELAIMLGVDEASVAKEIAAMEQENVICGYHTLIDWDKAGLEKVTAMIEVRVTPQHGAQCDIYSLAAADSYHDLFVVIICHAVSSVEISCNLNL